MQMSFDGIMTRRVVDEMKTALVGGRIVKIFQPGRFDVLLQVRKAESLSFLMSVAPSAMRIQLTRADIEKPPHPPRFAMFLRKHAEGARIERIEQHGNDRVVVVRLNTIDRFGERITRSLVYEGFGKDANIILLDEKDAVMDALKRLGPFDSKRTIQPGARYVFPEDDRVDPFDQEAAAAVFEEGTFVSPRDLTRRFQGVSPLFAREFLHRLSTERTMPATIWKTLLEETRFNILTNEKTVFSCVRLTHLEGEEKVFDSTQALLDDFYSVRDRQDRLRSQKRELGRFLARRIERLENKLESLARELVEAKDNETERRYGQLILTYQHAIRAGDRSLECRGFDGETDYDIPLDPKASPIENSNAYFKAYKKKKNAIPHLRREIAKAKNDVEYFTLLKAQLEDADREDTEEIRDELVRHRHLKKKPSRKPPKRKPFHTYEDADGVLILVGMNNRQNAEITHKLAHPDDVWFHVRSAPGSHVLARASQPLSETTIRTCAQLAAVFSSQKDASSVPVDYTEARRVKKIPGKRACFVRYDRQKTIHIDPDKAFVAELKKR